MQSSYHQGPASGRRPAPPTYDERNPPPFDATDDQLYSAPRFPNAPPRPAARQHGDARAPRPAEPAQRRRGPMMTIAADKARELEKSWLVEATIAGKHYKLCLPYRCCIRAGATEFRVPQWLAKKEGLL